SSPSRSTEATSCRDSRSAFSQADELAARVPRGRDLDAEAVRIEEERRVVRRAVLRPEPRRVEDLRTCCHRSRMYLLDLGLPLDRERQGVEPRGVQLEPLLPGRLTQAERARPGHRKPQVVDLLPALAG